MNAMCYTLAQKSALSSSNCSPFSLFQDEEWCWTAKDRCWFRNRAQAWNSRTTLERWFTARPTAVLHQGSTGWWAMGRRSYRYRTSVRCWSTAPCTSCPSAPRVTGTMYTRPFTDVRHRIASARCSAVKSRWRPVRETFISSRLFAAVHPLPTDWSFIVP